ncbi:(2Fe-2S)-binding protein [Telmatocola sphagniphila]|uniref:(2Fe-2S)-binding protein n=1 Tax=Telmatocola sphagniphila TaxID=1123043 RepID=A0A8E6ET09_9BACT|nr:2Fe-2S iron-sulfur cluster-binding protein [Telmatocola sphagniphila]QVL31744.1 (2Fe-2S)-binding protein [Telmatocola sphagniphila]
MSNDGYWFQAPPVSTRIPLPPAEPVVELVDITIDGRTVQAPKTSTILDVTRSLGIDTPTLCFLENLTPVNVCRICVVELTGARTLVPACSRKIEAGMVIQTDSPRVRLARKMVLEFLGSSVDLSTAPQAQSYIERYDAKPDRYGPRKESARTHDHAEAVDGTKARTTQVPVKIDNDLYVRDYSKCILCYKCVEACGTDAQNTFAIAVAGRGFQSHISTEADVPLPDSACVYCGNCIGVCPTGALMFKSEFDMRAAGTWDESKQTQTDTICSFCGVGCTLTLHVQDNSIVKVTSPLDVEVTHGHLCIKGRFGYQYVQNRDE